MINVNSDIGLKVPMTPLMMLQGIGSAISEVLKKTIVKPFDHRAYWTQEDEILAYIKENGYGR